MLFHTLLVLLISTLFVAAAPLPVPGDLIKKQIGGTPTVWETDQGGDTPIPGDWSENIAKDQLEPSKRSVNKRENEDMSQDLDLPDQDFSWIETGEELEWRHKRDSKYLSRDVGVPDQGLSWVETGEELEWRKKRQEAKVEGVSKLPVRSK